MSDVLVFKFPNLSSDSHTVIEEKFCDLTTAKRNGEILPPEAMDWLDSANVFLMTSGGT
jgi:hypothetical protein